jgi:hypothetical protein
MTYRGPRQGLRFDPCKVEARHVARRASGRPSHQPVNAPVEQHSETGDRQIATEHHSRTNPRGHRLRQQRDPSRHRGGHQSHPSKFGTRLRGIRRIAPDAAQRGSGSPAPRSAGEHRRLKWRRPPSDLSLPPMPWGRRPSVERSGRSRRRPARGCGQEPGPANPPAPAGR